MKLKRLKQKKASIITKNNEKNKAIIIICTMPNDTPTALSIVKTLITNKLAACVTFLPNARSIYYWNDNLHEQEEIQLLIKTYETLEQSVFKHIKITHPYQTPELLTLKISSGEYNYLSWMHEMLT